MKNTVKNLENTNAATKEMVRRFKEILIDKNKAISMGFDEDGEEIIYNINEKYCIKEIYYRGFTIFECPDFEDLDMSLIEKAFDYYKAKCKEESIEYLGMGTVYSNIEEFIKGYYNK